MIHRLLCGTKTYSSPRPTTVPVLVLWLSTSLRTIPVPYVQSFDIDLDSGILTLSFEGPVNISSVNVEAISLSDGGSQSLILSLHSPNAGLFTPFITLFFPPQYPGYLVSLGICRTHSSCYIFFTEDFISDPYNNAVIPIPSEIPLLVSLHYYD